MPRNYKRSANKKEETKHIEEFTEARKNKGKDITGLDYRIKLKFKTETQKKLYETILENRITFVNGPAGCGKSMIALMAALECLKNNKYNINKIVLTQPAIESSASIGLLPGDVSDKTFLYFSSFYENISKLVGSFYTTFLKGNKFIDEQLLNFMRGNTFGTYDDDGNPQGWIIIGDEFQNTTAKELKLFISRLGEYSKMVILGDIDQTDLKLRNSEKSGLEDGFERFKDIPGISYVTFNEDDIVRDPFLKEIMKRYKK